ncbi:MAG: endonuclease III [Planctomycetes bacterium]|nr:endonuclease III [Planctomycetota bacterium]
MARKTTRKALAAQAEAIAAGLAEAYPDAGCALTFADPLGCLISTILSAQTTDKSVNAVTPALFQRFPTVAALAAATPEEVEPFIRSLGLFRAKAKNIVATAVKLRDEFGGVVPDTIEELVTLPGVGRKTANCVVLNAYGKPGIMCDTHFCRLTRRFGLHDLTDPGKIEQQIASLLPPEQWGDFSHRTIVHGREVCHARKPACATCPIASLCAFRLEK